MPLRYVCTYVGWVARFETYNGERVGTFDGHAKYLQTEMQSYLSMKTLKL